MNKAVFLDKDGTLVDDYPYNVDPALIKLSEKSIEGLKQLQDAGYLLIVVSNQSGLAFDYFTEDELLKAKEKVINLLNEKGVRLDGFYYCPHHLEGKVQQYAIICPCRKPKPGLILQAAKDMSVDISSSWMIGDILHDVEAGQRAGCRTILINNGNETEWIMNEYRIPEKKFANINEAAAYIIANADQEKQLAGV